MILAVKNLGNSLHTTIVGAFEHESEILYCREFENSTSNAMSCALAQV